MDAGQSLQHEVAPFGISTTIVNPGIFRTELLTTESVTYVESSLEDYADHTAEHLKSWDALNGQEAGDPAKLAQALLTIAGQERPPRALHRRHRRDRLHRAEGRRPPAADRSLPRSVDFPRARRRGRGRLMSSAWTPGRTPRGRAPRGPVRGEPR